MNKLIVFQTGVSGSAKRRAYAAVLALLGVPLCLYCSLTHFCAYGHLKHEVTAVDLSVDAVWIPCFVAAAIFASGSDMKYKIIFILLCAGAVYMLPADTMFSPAGQAIIIALMSWRALTSLVRPVN